MFRLTFWRLFAQYKTYSLQPTTTFVFFIFKIQSMAKSSCFANVDKDDIAFLTILMLLSSISVAVFLSKLFARKMCVALKVCFYGFETVKSTAGWDIVLVRGQHIKIFKNHTSRNKHFKRQSQSYESNWTGVNGNVNGRALQPCLQPPPNQYVTIYIGSVHECAGVHQDNFNSTSHGHQSEQVKNDWCKNEKKESSVSVFGKRTEVHTCSAKKQYEITSPGIRAWEEPIEDNFNGAMSRLGMVCRKRPQMEALNLKNRSENDGHM